MRFCFPEWRSHKNLLSRQKCQKVSEERPSGIRKKEPREPKPKDLSLFPSRCFGKASRTSGEVWKVLSSSHLHLRIFQGGTGPLGLVTTPQGCSLNLMSLRGSFQILGTGHFSPFAWCPAHDFSISVGASSSLSSVACSGHCACSLGWPKRQNLI